MYVAAVELSHETVIFFVVVLIFKAALIFETFCQRYNKHEKN